MKECLRAVRLTWCLWRGGGCSRVHLAAENVGQIGFKPTHIPMCTIGWLKPCTGFLRTSGLRGRTSVRTHAFELPVLEYASISKAPLHTLVEKGGSRPSLDECTCLGIQMGVSTHLVKTIVE